MVILLVRHTLQTLTSALNHEWRGCSSESLFSSTLICVYVFTSGQRIADVHGGVLTGAGLAAAAVHHWIPVVTECTS